MSAYPHERLVVGVQQALERAQRGLLLAEVQPCRARGESPADVRRGDEQSRRAGVGSVMARWDVPRQGGWLRGYRGGGLCDAARVHVRRRKRTGEAGHLQQLGHRLTLFARPRQNLRTPRRLSARRPPHRRRCDLTRRLSYDTESNSPASSYPAAWRGWGSQNQNPDRAFPGQPPLMYYWHLGR
jgi:hypothetical protein